MCRIREIGLRISGNNGNGFLTVIVVSLGLVELFVTRSAINLCANSHEFRWGCSMVNSHHIFMEVSCRSVGIGRTGLHPFDAP